MTRSISTCIVLMTLLAAGAPLAAQSPVPTGESGGGTIESMTTTRVYVDSMRVRDLSVPDLGAQRRSAATPRIRIDDVSFSQWPVVAPPLSKTFVIRNTSIDGGELVVTGIATPSGPFDRVVFADPGDIAGNYPVFPLRLSAGEESKPITVTFDPQAPIHYMDSILFTHNAGPDPGNDSVALLNGEGILSTLAATSKEWGRQPVGTGPYYGTVRLMNVGNQEIHVTDATMSGDVSDFTFDRSLLQNLTLPGGASVNIPVTFSPTAIGQRQAVITYNHEVGDAVVTSILNGISVESTLEVTSMNWGRRRVHTGPHAGSIRLTNTGDTEIELVNGTVTGPITDFAINLSGIANAKLPAGATREIPVGFLPTAIGPRRVVVNLIHSGSSEPTPLVLEGIGVEPTLGTHDINFGVHSVGSPEVEMETKFYLVSNGDPSYVDSVTIVNFNFPPHPSFRYEVSAGESLPFVLNSFDDTLRIRSFYSPRTTGMETTTLTAVTEDFNAAHSLVQATSNWNAEATGSSRAPGDIDGAGLALGPVAPSPTDGWTTLGYTIPNRASVQITLVDITGRTVATMLETSTIAAGSHTLRFDASALAAGTYFCRMIVGERVLVQALLVR